MPWRRLHDRQRLLLRGNALVLAGVVLTFVLSDFPHNRATAWLCIPALMAIAGTANTARCLQPRWNLFHGGVILCLYMDLMAVAMTLFALLYPYVVRLATTR